MDLKVYFLLYNLFKKNLFFKHMALFLNKWTFCFFICTYFLGCIHIFLYNKETLYKFIAIPLTLLICTLFIKKLVKRQRPFNRLNLKNTFNKKTTAFPSSHSSSSLIIAISYFNISTLLGCILIFISILTGLSRIFIGIHYPSDVLGGFILALIIGYLYVLI